MFTRIPPNDIVRLKNLKESLEAAKSNLDNIPNCGIITSFLDPFKEYKYTIAKKLQINIITNAWLKCFEILNKYNLINQNSKEINHFDNASLPGAFILATEYFVNSHYPHKQYKWKASSLIDDNKEHLTDIYGLYLNNPKNWLMTDTNNGDITDKNNIDDICEKLNDLNGENTIDLYTSDLGFDVSHDYNNQEIEHFVANSGQILTCIKVLKKGGSCIIKHYTYFENHTMYYLSMFRELFEEFYIDKPFSSKELNSEVYLVGRKFTNNTDIIKKLSAYLEKCIQNNLYDMRDINNKVISEFLHITIDFTERLYRTQIASLYKVKYISDGYEKMTKGESLVKRKLIKYIKTFTKKPYVEYQRKGDKYVLTKIKYT